MKIEHAGIGYRFRAESDHEANLLREIIKRGIPFQPEGVYQDMAGYAPLTAPYIHIMPVKPEESRVMADKEIQAISIDKAVNGYTVRVSHNDEELMGHYEPDALYVATSRDDLLKLLADEILKGE